MSNVTPWPKSFVRLSPCLVEINGGGMSASMHYALPGESGFVAYEALEAALSKLRVAVEALQTINKHGFSGSADCAGKALTTIGPLPEGDG